MIYVDDYATSFPVLFGFRLGCIYILGLVNTSFDGHMKNIEGFFFLFPALQCTYLFSPLFSFLIPCLHFIGDSVFHLFTSVFLVSDVNYQILSLYIFCID